jgi:hypothetical protein
VDVPWAKAPAISASAWRRTNVLCMPVNPLGTREIRPYRSDIDDGWVRDRARSKCGERGTSLGRFSRGRAINPVGLRLAGSERDALHPLTRQRYAGRRTTPQRAARSRPAVERNAAVPDPAHPRARTSPGPPVATTATAAAHGPPPGGRPDRPRRRRTCARTAHARQERCAVRRRRSCWPRTMTWVCSCGSPARDIRWRYDAATTPRRAVARRRRGRAASSTPRAPDTPEQRRQLARATPTTPTRRVHHRSRTARSRSSAPRTSGQTPRPLTEHPSGASPSRLADSDRASARENPPARPLLRTSTRARERPRRATARGDSPRPA